VLGLGIWVASTLLALAFSVRALAGGADRVLALAAAALAGVEGLLTLAVLAISLFD